MCVLRCEHFVKALFNIEQTSVQCFSVCAEILNSLLLCRLHKTFISSVKCQITDGQLPLLEFVTGTNTHAMFADSLCALE